MNRDFNKWLDTFRASINQYNYYTDFSVVYEKAAIHKTEINILNSLINERNIEEKFEEIIKEYPKTLSAIPILLAVREYEIYCQDAETAVNYRFDKMTQTIDEYKYFMRETGLFDMLQNHIISNLYDYVMGVEVGLGSNGRKNRGGHQMEDLVEEFIKKTGVEYYKEMYLEEIEKKWNIDLSAISSDNTSTKRWDFVVKTNKLIYVIETNFYTSGGSKLNETARSYKMLAAEAATVDKIAFVWITDGGGWRSARRNLAETFNTMQHIYNIEDLENGRFEELFL